MCGHGYVVEVTGAARGALMPSAGLYATSSTTAPPPSIYSRAPSIVSRGQRSAVHYTEYIRVASVVTFYHPRIRNQSLVLSLYLTTGTNLHSLIALHTIRQKPAMEANDSLETRGQPSTERSVEQTAERQPVNTEVTRALYTREQMNNMTSEQLEQSNEN